jgi:hypothetical protein
MSYVDTLKSLPLLWLEELQSTPILNQVDVGEPTVARGLALTKWPNSFDFAMPSRVLFPGVQPEFTITFRGAPGNPPTLCIEAKPEDFTAPFNFRADHRGNAYRGTIEHISGSIVFSALTAIPVHEAAMAAEDELYNLGLEASALGHNYVELTGKLQGQSAPFSLRADAIVGMLLGGDNLNVTLNAATPLAHVALVKQAIPFTATVGGLGAYLSGPLTFEWSAEHFDPPAAQAGPAMATSDARTFRCPSQPMADLAVTCTVTAACFAELNTDFKPAVARARGVCKLAVVNQKQLQAILNAIRASMRVGPIQPTGPLSLQSNLTPDVFRRLGRDAAELAARCQEAVEQWPAPRKAPTKKPASKA